MEKALPINPDWSRSETYDLPPGAHLVTYPGVFGPESKEIRVDHVTRVRLTGSETVSSVGFVVMGVGLGTSLVMSLAVVPRAEDQVPYAVADATALGVGIAGGIVALATAPSVAIDSEVPEAEERLFVAPTVGGAFLGVSGRF